MAQEFADLTTTKESLAAMKQRVDSLTREVRDSRQVQQELQSQLEGAERKVRDGIQLEGELKSKLKEVELQDRGVPMGVRSLEGLTVGEIFDLYGLSKTHPDGSQIPDYLLTKRFSKTFELTTDTGKTTSEQRKLRLVAAAFVHHSLGVLHDDRSGLLDLVLDALSPDKGNEEETIKENAIRDSAIVQSLVDAVRDSIANKDNHSTTAGILAPLTAQYKRSDMLGSFQLDVSQRLWRYARWHTLAWGVQGTAATDETWYFRGDKDQVVQLVQFAEDNVQVIAFGKETITGINGEQLTIPPLLRTQARSQLYEEYKELVKAGEQKPISMTEFYEFMGDIAKTDPKALSALDPAAVRGKKAIETLRSVLLPELGALVKADPADLKVIDTLLVDAQSSISGIEKHLIETKLALCETHCMQHLLCDPLRKDQASAEPCDHEHRERCLSCERYRVVRVQMEHLLGKLPSTPGAIDEPKTHLEIRGLVQRNLAYLDQYYYHEIRGAHESAMPSKVLESLDESTCYTTSDWKVREEKYHHAET